IFQAAVANLVPSHLAVLRVDREPIEPPVMPSTALAYGHDIERPTTWHLKRRREAIDGVPGKEEGRIKLVPPLPLTINIFPTEIVGLCPEDGVFLLPSSLDRWQFRE